MRKMRVAGAGLAVAIAAAVGCSDGPTSVEPISRLSQPIGGGPGWATEPNEFSQAIGARPFPNSESVHSEQAWRVVPAGAFNARLAQMGAADSDLRASEHFFDGAQVANDGWSAGIFVQPGDYSLGGEVTFGYNWVVVDDARIDPNTEVVFGSNYRLVNVPMELETPFLGFAPAIFMQLGAAGTERCCGPEKLCETQGGPQNPHCPNGYCAGETVMYQGKLYSRDARLASGFSFVPAQTFGKNKLFEAACLAPRNPNCFAQTPICGAEVLGNPPWGTFSADVPVGSGSCGGSTRPVVSRVVPKQCLYRNQSVASVRNDSYTVGRGFSQPECDGQCYECEVQKRPADANIRPRQCDLMRPMPGDPAGLPGSAGSGVCTSTAASSGAEQAQLRSAAGTCQTIEARDGPLGTPVYLKACVECSLTECHQTMRRAPSHIANPGANTNTPKPCNATQANCPPLAAGTGGGGAGGGGMGTGGAGGGGVSNPPVSQTTAPPPQAKPVPTDRTVRTPATDTKNGAQKSVTPKGEKVNDPIALASGAFEMREVDLSFPGPVRPLEFARSYDSRSKDRSTLGSNWSHNWDVRVVPLNDENRPGWTDPYCAGGPHETTCIILYVGETPQLFYREFLSGVFVPQAGLTSTLIPLAAPAGTPDSLTGWLLESADGHNLMFDTDGYLIKDVDRFGNGFALDYEPTPSGRLFAALCPRGIVEMAADPSDPLRSIIRPQQGPVYNSDSLDCRALGSIVGVRAPVARLPSGAATLSFNVPAGSNQDFLNAKALVEALQNTSGRQPGSPMPWGARLKRVTRVKEITATDGSTVTGTGRELVFEYNAHGSASLPGSLSALTSTGLLSAVTGPAGARVEFAYQSAESAAGHPTFLNEAFLVEAKRADGAAPPGLSATPVRSTVFTYAWTRNALSATAITNLRNSFNQFWLAQSDCTFTPVDNCGSKRPPAIVLMDLTAELADVEASFRADVADNIIRVDNANIVESETRYDVDPFSLSFDRAVRQRWGSTFATAMTSVAPDWDTTLPEASLAFAEAMPIGGGQDDATTAFLPAAIASRYGLEPVPTGPALTLAQGSGMLLAPNTPSGTIIPGQNAPIAEGTKVPTDSSSSKPPCRNQELPILRTRLPGYRPSFEYYDLTPQVPHPDSDTQGINVATFTLKRSRLSCDVLARAQTSDARTSELMWTWQNNASGQMVANRSLGRRQHVTLNANRICAWVRNTDRDGFLRYVGVNFQGRPLVDAVQGADNAWRFAETLYNADGNVISQRKTLPESTPWADGRGDTRYTYLDLVQQAPPANPVQPMPWYWARRANVLRVVERPRGGTITEYLESAGGNATVFTTGRYTSFEYEPLFNQVRKVRTGWLDVANTEQLTATTEIVYDYQEGMIANIVPILERQRALGFSWATDTSQNLVLSQVLAEIAVPFGLGDVNGDGTVTLTGLPSLVYYRPAGGGQEVSTFRWNRGGRLIWTQTTDGAVQTAPNLPPTGGSIIELEYLPLGAFAGTASVANTGFLGSLHHTPRKTWPTNQGPTRAPCPHLQGPYQWLLPSSCSSTNLAGQLTSQRFLPVEVANAIVTQQAATRDGTTTYQYHVTGQVKRIAGPDPRVVEFDRDVDGRSTVERLYDNGVEHSRTITTYDTLLRPVEVKRMSASTYLGATKRVFDEEDRIVYECQEFTQGGCARSYHGDLPVSGASQTNWYSPEGLLRQTQDPVGLTTLLARDARGWIISDSRYRAPADGTRLVEFSYDDDGRVTEKKFQSGMLYEKRAYDGYGRLFRAQDTEQRWFDIHRTPRDTTVRVNVATTQGGVALWYQWFEFDTFGRVIREYTNGTTSAELTEEVQRRPGGQVWWARGYGQRPTFSTTDADGNTLWSEDEDAELATVATASPDSREQSSSTIRLNTWLTSSTRTTRDVLGLPSIVTEAGAGNGRTALSRSTSFIRNPSGFVRFQNDPDLKSTEFDHDLAGRVLAKRESIGSPAVQFSTLYSYDARGSLLTVTDPNSEFTRYIYNSFGQPIERNSPGRSSTLVATWTYDALGRTKNATPAPGSTYEHVYNNKNQLIGLRLGDVNFLRQYTYDSLGRLDTAVNYNVGLTVPTGQNVVTNTFGYDWLGRVSLERSKIGNRVARDTISSFSTAVTSWSPVIRSTTSASTSTVREFDSLGRQSRITRGSGANAPTTDFAYNANLQTSQASNSTAGLVRTLIAYDALAQPLGWNTRINGQNALQVDVLRDAAGRIGSYKRQDWQPPTVTTPQHSWRGYTYDSMRRIGRLYEANSNVNVSALQTHALTNADVDSVGATSGATRWDYDREQNVGSTTRISSPTAGSPRSPRFEVTGATGRMPGYSLPNYKRGTETTKAVAHDLFGRVTTDTLDTFSWTILSELRSVTANSGSTSTSEQYQYDGLGRMVARLTPAGSVTEEYAYDGAQMVGAWNGAQSLVWSATWGPGLDNLVAIKFDTTTYLAIGDGRGSIGGFIHEGMQRVASTLDYTPEGRVQWQNYSSSGTATLGCSQLTDPLADCDAGPNAIPFGFHSAFKSPGSGLIYFRNRWLSTRTGEWLSQDPLGPVDSSNLYSFNAFDSVNGLDPLGLSSNGPAKGRSFDLQATIVTGIRAKNQEDDSPIPYPEDPDESPAPAMMGPGPSKGMTSPARTGGGVEAGPLCDADCRIALRPEPAGGRRGSEASDEPMRASPARPGRRGGVSLTSIVRTTLLAELFAAVADAGVKMPERKALIVYGNPRSVLATFGGKYVPWQLSESNRASYEKAIAKEVSRHLGLIDPRVMPLENVANMKAIHALGGGWGTVVWVGHALNGVIEGSQPTPTKDGFLLDASGFLNMLGGLPTNLVGYGCKLKRPEASKGGDIYFSDGIPASVHLDATDRAVRFDMAVDGPNGQVRGIEFGWKPTKGGN